MSNNHRDIQTIDPHANRITVRMANADDTSSLRRLAELDSAERLRLPALIGELGGAPVAAHSMEDGRTVADPFRHTSEIVELLQARARSLHSDGGLRRQSGWRTTGLRAAPASSSRRTGVV